MGVLPSVIFLGLLVVAALKLSSRRVSPTDRFRERDQASVALATATLLQALHFAEEASGGLHESLPAVFGLNPIPFALFLLFNLACLTVWLASVRGLRKGHRPAFAAAWFLALSGIANGIAHPLLALAERTYFPGLYSSLPLAATCTWLARRLQLATRRRR